MSNQDFIKRASFFILAVIGIVLLWQLRSIVVMGIAALAIAIGVNVPARWLQKRGLGRGVATLISGIVILLIALVLTIWIVPTLISEMIVILSRLPSMAQATLDAYENLRANNDFLAQTLPSLEINSFQELEGMLGLESDRLRNIAQNILGTGASSLFAGLGFFGSMFTNLFFILFITAFFLYEPTAYVKASLYLVPQSYRGRLLEIWDALYKTITTWVSALFLSISITVSLVLLIMGVLLDMPFALIVAVFAGLATFVPNIGAFLPIIPITIFSLAERPSWLLIYIGVYLLIQLTESNVITPMIIKSELDIPAGGLMLFQLAITIVLGALGLLFAVPILAIIITLVREIYSKDILGMGDEKIEVTSTLGEPLQMQEISGEP